jgi:hypothetical protein
MVWNRKLHADRPMRFESVWRAAGGAGLLTRIGITFLGAIVGLILWSTGPQWLGLARDLRRGVLNLRAQRPFMEGLETIDSEAIWGSLRVVFWTLGGIVSAAGVIIIAGGGTFGGGGALIHW